MSLSVNRSLALAIGLMLTGCAAVHPTLPTLGTAQPTRSATLVLQPKVTAGRYVQSVVNPYTASDIDHLWVIPYRLVGGVGLALDPSTGEATNSIDASKWLKLSIASSSLEPGRSITFSNLRPDTRYGIQAIAFDKDNHQISRNLSSFVEFTLTNDDRPTTGDLPVVLSDTPFAASATVTLTNHGGREYDHVKISHVTVINGTEVPIASASTTVLAGFHPGTFNLANLQPYTTYRVKASVEDAINSVLATASVDVPVTNETSPPPVTLLVPTPYVSTTVAGAYNEAGATDGPGADARFVYPFGVATDLGGNVYVPDYGNATIRKITPEGIVSTIAGSAMQSGYWNANGANARFGAPEGVAVDVSGNVYVTDHNHTIRKITPLGDVTTLAGSPQEPGSADGNGTNARFNYPNAIAVDASGSLYVTDRQNHTIRKITSDGDVTTFAGTANQAGSADGTGTAARFNGPAGVAVDKQGVVYVADQGNHCVRKISPTGVVTTFAGEPYQSFDPITWQTHTRSADGVGSAAGFYQPSGLALDASGNLYVVDTGNRLIRKITPTGIVTTIAGSVDGWGGTDGIGQNVTFLGPVGVAVDGNGNVYVADQSARTIRKLR